MATGLSSLENLVECALCLEGYKTPRGLPCQHCFCEDCLKQHISKNSKPGGTFQCPSCRQEVDIPKKGVAGFPVSFTLNKLQDTLHKLSKQKCNNCEKSGTTKMCSECENLLCIKCFPSHHHSTSETSTDDPTAELGGAFGGLESIILESVFCKKHPKKHMSLYCEDCKEAICNACTANHKRHVIIDGEEKASLEETSISENVAKMMTKLQLCQDQGDLMEEKEKGRCNVDEVISQVKSRRKEGIGLYVAFNSLGVESTYEHESTKTAASARNLLQKPVLIHSLSLPLGDYKYIRDIAVCEDGEVYVATNRGIKVYSAAGVYTHTIAHDTDACSIAELPGGKLAISCWYDETVKVFSKDGSYVHTISAGQGIPYGVALLHNGALAVCYPWEKCVRVFKDCGERAAVVSDIRRFTLERSRQQPTTRRQEERGFQRPWYLTAHGENGLIVSDVWANAVYAFTAGDQGEYTCQWMYGGEQGKGPGMLNVPYGVATDSQGRVLIADYHDHRVLQLSHDGEMLMELLTQQDGLNYPEALAVGAGKLAVQCQNTGIKIILYNYM